MAYNDSRVAELIQSLANASRKNPASVAEYDYYLKLIAIEAKILKPEELPETLETSHRKLILTFVREVQPDFFKLNYQILELSSAKGGSRNGDR